MGFPGADLPADGRRGADARPPYVPGAEPATGAFERPGAALGAAPGPGEPRPGAPGTDIVRPAPRPHGLIAIYTLLEDKVADFDRVADEAAEQVRAQEPDTLVYVIHTVPKAPMQRIFYEIYRDRAAYERHEQQPYIKRFVNARRPFVLATNVIELRLKYAKISPLVQAEAQVPSPVGALPPAGPAAPASRAPAPGGRAPAGPRPLATGGRGTPRAARVTDGPIVACPAGMTGGPGISRAAGMTGGPGIPHGAGVTRGPGKARGAGVPGRPRRARAAGMVDRPPMPREPVTMPAPRAAGGPGNSSRRPCRRARTAGSDGMAAPDGPGLAGGHSFAGGPGPAADPARQAGTRLRPDPGRQAEVTGSRSSVSPAVTCATRPGR